MKNLHLSKGLVVLLVAALLWGSCRKQISQDSPDEPQNFSEQRVSGVVPDDPIAVSKVPLIISANFLMQNPEADDYLFSSARRKPARTFDVTPPTVSIISPANGSSVSGTVNITVNASDNNKVASVSLSVDGGNAISNSNIAPFTNIWNSGTVTNGSHTLNVTATDASGNKATSSVQVTVDNTTPGDIIPPTVGFISPADQASLTGVVTVSISATDNIGVSSVSISIDNTVVSTSANYSWNTSNYAAGYHTIKATATDAAGNQGSGSVTVLVNITVVQPPTSSGVSLTMPPVGDQGGEGCCVPFAVGYGARSAEQYYRTNAASYSNSTNVFSPEFLYNQVKFGADCGSGTSMQVALDFIVANGICPYQSMPYSSTNGCTLLPTVTQLSEALNYKIGSYSKIINTDKDAIKSMVSQNHPVIVTILADNSFVNATAGFIWKTFSGSGNLPHCIVICGYDDSKNAYKIMNSWGTTWGDAGFSWIDYDFFPTKTGTYCYVIN
jgi:hypothetical protein